MPVRTDLLAVLDTCGLSSATCAAYRTYATLLMKQFKTDDVYDVIRNVDKSITWIRRHYGSGDASKKNMIAAILAIFKHNKGLETEMPRVHEKWRAAYEEFSERLDDRYKTNQPSEKQSAGYVPFADIEAMRDKLEKGSMDRLLLAMYTMIRPLRGDFGAVRIYKGNSATGKGNENYLVLRDSLLVLNDYKTARSKGAHHATLPPALMSEIRASLVKRPRDYLFVKSDGTPYDLGNSYVRYANNTLKRLFDRPLTLSLIRHSYISSLDFNKLSIAEKEEIAAEMAHTVGMQDKYRFVFDRKEG